MSHLIKKSWTDSSLDVLHIHFSPRSIFDLQTASNCCLLQLFNAFFIAFQNLTYVQNPSYPTAESGSTAMSCVYVVNAVASAPGKEKIQIVKINNKKIQFVGL